MKEVKKAVEDKLAAEGIEVKKIVRKAARKAKDADSVYVRVDENMLYWVRGSETEAVNIW